MSDEQFIFFGFEDLSSKIEREVPLDKSVLKSNDGIFVYNEPFCKHYHSRKLVKNDYNTRELYTTDGEKILLKFKDIIVKNVAHTLKLNFYTITMPILIFTKIP